MSRKFCTLCVAEVFISENARAFRKADQRKIVIDEGRAHVCLTRRARDATLKKIDDGGYQRNGGEGGIKPK